MNFANDLHEEIFNDLIVLGVMGFSNLIFRDVLVRGDLFKSIKGFVGFENHPEEYERWVSDIFVDDVKRKMPVVWDLRAWGDDIFKHKIKITIEGQG